MEGQKQHCVHEYSQVENIKRHMNTIKHNPGVRDLLETHIKLILGNVSE